MTDTNTLFAFFIRTGSIFSEVISMTTSESWITKVREEAHIPDAKVILIEPTDWDAPKLTAADADTVKQAWLAIKTNAQNALVERGLSQSLAEESTRRPVAITASPLTGLVVITFVQASTPDSLIQSKPVAGETSVVEEKVQELAQTTNKGRKFYKFHSQKGFNIPALCCSCGKVIVSTEKHPLCVKGEKLDGKYLLSTSIEFRLCEDCFHSLDNFQKLNQPSELIVFWDKMLRGLGFVVGFAVLVYIIYLLQGNFLGFFLGVVAYLVISLITTLLRLKFTNDRERLDSLKSKEEYRQARDIADLVSESVILRLIRISIPSVQTGEIILFFTNEEFAAAFVSANRAAFIGEGNAGF